MTDRWEKESQKYAIHKIVLLCLYTYLLTIILLFSTIIILPSRSITIIFFSNSFSIGIMEKAHDTGCPVTNFRV